MQSFDWKFAVTSVIRIYSNTNYWVKNPVLNRQYQGGWNANQY